MSGEQRVVSEKLANQRIVAGAAPPTREDGGAKPPQADLEGPQLPEGARVVDGEVLFRKRPPVKRPWYYSPYFWGAVFGLITMPLLRPLLRKVPKPPPVMRQLPTWSLIDQDGKPFGSKQLAGRVYIVNFFFSSCVTVCPPLMKSMAEVQAEIERLKKVPVHLVSITVDPENDTPAKLREVAKKYGAKRGKWTLLTARDPMKIYKLVTKGFIQHMDPPARGKHPNAKHAKHAKHAKGVKLPAAKGPAMAIAHSASMVLVDHDGGIRGFYKRHKEWGVQEVVHRAVQTHLAWKDKQ